MADAGVPRRSGPRLDGTSPGPAEQICCPGKPSDDWGGVAGRVGRAGQAKLLFGKDLCFSSAHLYPCRHSNTPWLLSTESDLALRAFSSRPAHMLPVLSLTHQPARSYYFTLLQNLLSAVQSRNHILLPRVCHYSEVP